MLLQGLEPYKEIILLTTNRVKQINDAIASRIHLPFEVWIAWRGYKEVSGSFLQKAVTENEAAYYSSKDLDFLTEKDHNGR